MMSDLDAFQNADFTDLNYLIVGGEPMPIPVIEQWQNQGVPVRQGYGMTEVGPNLTSLNEKDAVRKKGSIGRPNFYVQTKIVDASGKLSETNTGGELLLKGPMVTRYWNNPEATTKSIENGWFKTGDIAREDQDGYLFILDRIKNMYISGGENVYPAEVERIINEIEAVSEVAVIGIPDEKWGESGKAFVVLKPKMELDAKDILTYCSSKLAKFKIPKSIVFLKEIPKTDSGKLNKKQLF